MPQLTAKQKLAALFSLTVFFLIVGFSALFVFLYRFTFAAQTKQLLYTELTNISMNHLVVDNNAITFVKDQGVQSLKEHLASTGISAVFYDNRNTILRAYGTFGIPSVQSEVLIFAQEVRGRRTVMTTEMTLAQVRTLILGSPILNSKNEAVGVLLLSQPLKSRDEAVLNLIFICMSSATISFLVSFLIGHLLVRKGYREIDSITRTISEIDLNQLHRKVVAKGHPEDEVVQLANRFNEMIDRLQHMSQRQKEFVANASHELQTPLTRIISSIDAIEPSKGFPSRDLEEIRSELFALSETISKLLLLGKVREHDAPRGATPLRETVGSIFERLEKSLGNNKYTLRMHIDPMIMMPMPEHYANVVVANILGNALKYSGDSRQIDVEAQRVNSEVHFCIRDYGIGMDKKEVEQLFERFVRGGNSRGIQGAGIGLSLVKTICNIYDISINVLSEKNKGTTIQLSWRMVPANEIERN